MIKQLSLTLILFLTAVLSTHAQTEAFITTWNTGEDGSITIPVSGYPRNYHVVVKSTDSNEVLTEVDATASTTISELPANANIKVEITGQFPSIYMTSSDSREELLSIDQWGSIEWKSMYYSFSDCPNLICKATDAPNLSNVTNMASMFYKSSSFTGDLSNWDVSNVTDMKYMFDGANSFNSDLSKWNVSKVTRMDRMFFDATFFNSDLSAWDVSNVTSMKQMFGMAKAFTSDLSKWNVSKVTDMYYMFAYVESFTSDLSAWDVSSVTTMNMMFYFASSFNSDISKWNVSNVKDMAYMFRGASSFNSDLSTWDVSNVTNMDYIFNRASSFNQDLSTWSVSSEITPNLNMFYGTVSGVYYTINYNNKGEAFWGFYPSTHNNITLRTYENSGANIFYGWYDNEGYTGSPISEILEETKGDLSLYAKWSEPNTDAFITTWNTGEDGSITIPTKPDYTYNYQVLVKDKGTNEVLTTVDATGDVTIANLPVSDEVVVEISGNFPAIYFNNRNYANELMSIDQWGNIIWKSMERAFYGCTSLVNIAVDIPNISEVSNLSYMFASAESFNADLSKWDVSKITDMSSMFNGASSFISDLSLWDAKVNVNRTDMFTNAGDTYYTITYNRDGIETLGFYPATHNEIELKTAEESDGIPFNAWYQQADYSGSPFIVLESGTTGDITLYAKWNTPNPDAFLTQWNTGTDGSITIPINSDYTYNYHIIVKDAGSYEILAEEDATGEITFDELSVDTDVLIEITGDFPAIYMYGSSSREDLLSVEHWGTIQWQSMEYAFFDCDFLINATDTPDLSAVTSLSYMLFSSNITDGLSNWDVSNITNMSYTFASANNYADDLSGWDVSKVIDMQHTFELARAFQCDLSKWDVSNVVNMESMFENAILFNSDISGWNVGKVTNMKRTLYYATSFNGSLSTWDVSKVTTMQNMFCGAKLFNSDLSSWNVKEVTDMFGMFDRASAFNQDLSAWSAGVNTNVLRMFNEAGDTYYKIYYHTDQETYIGFYPAGHNDITLRNLETNEGFPFKGWYKESDFSGAVLTKLTQGIQEDIHLYAQWNVPNDEAFITTWNPGTDASITIPTNSNLVYNYRVLVSNADTKEMITELDATGNITIDNLPDDVTSVTVEITGDFPAICMNNSVAPGKLTSINQWGNIAWQTMESAFAGCYNLTYSAVDEPDLSGVTSLSQMFNNDDVFSGDISSWDVSHVTDMSHMFDYAKAFNGDLSSWDVSNVTNMAGMFYNARAFNADLSLWDVSKVIDMSSMFYAAQSFNQDISAWEVNQVSEMDNMFNGATSFDHDLSAWNAQANVNRSLMFFNAGDTYYTITYHVDGIETLGFYPAGHSDITLRILEAKGEEPFNGWYEDVDFSGDVIKTLAEGITSDMTLYAKWGVNTSTRFDGVSSISYYPNPVVNQLNLKGLEGRYISGFILNSSGITVMKFSLSLNDTESHIEMGDYAPGIYLLQLNRADGTAESYKLIKK